MNGFKRAGWHLLQCLPIAAAEKILEASGREDAAYLAARNKKYGFAVRLAVWKILSSAIKRGNWNGVLLIGGPPRIGKTIISQSVASRLGAATIVSLDEYRLIWDRAPDSLRAGVKRDFIDRLCRQGHGLVIEGVDLITNDRVSRPPAGGPRLCASVISSFSWHANAKCIVLGAATQAPSLKLEGIRQGAQSNYCWAVKRFDDQQLMRLARQIVESSEALRRAAAGTCVHYFDLPPVSFADAAVAVAEKIVSLTEGQAAQPVKADRCPMTSG